jgi:hypothetical protein
MISLKTFELTLQQAKIVHGNKFAYYPDSFVSSSKKMKIECSEHGYFWQSPDNHIRKEQGCPDCAGNKPISLKKFITASNIIHNYFYDYSLITEINGIHNKVNIICPDHGIFKQSASSHMNGGCGCADCAKNKKLSVDVFKKRANIVHESRYDYSNVTQFINIHDLISIICIDHGNFTQEINNHLRGHGCPKCNQSKGELLISIILKSLNIKYFEQHKFNDCKNIYQLPFDFYLPDLNICLEFDGEQHFKAKTCFGGMDGFEKTKVNDFIKDSYCNNNDIKLYRISYKDDIETEMNKIIINENL